MYTCTTTAPPVVVGWWIAFDPAWNRCRPPSYTRYGTAVQATSNIAISHSSSSSFPPFLIFIWLYCTWHYVESQISWVEKENHFRPEFNLFLGYFFFFFFKFCPMCDVPVDYRASFVLLGSETYPTTAVGNLIECSNNICSTSSAVSGPH
jgi:hypothetical protein